MAGEGSQLRDVDPDRGRVLLEEPEEPWILVPLGNPGADYADTRHNLGRLMLQRWMDDRKLRLGPIHRFPSGTLYSLRDPFLALVPGTWMNLSGQVCGEAVREGFNPARLLLLHDEKDLPLGLGRLKQDGGDGGHNGLRSVLEHLGTDAVPRLRLGIGPIERPLHDYVLGRWTESEWGAIACLDAPFAAALDLLASGRPLEQVMGLANAETFWMDASQEGPAAP